MPYKLEGRLLEVCNCNIACPCWLGEDPDYGECYSVEGYRVDQGTIDGVDVSGLTMGVVSYIPGNILAGNHRVVLVVDDRATEQQQEALVNAWTGKLGGPVAEVAQLWAEVAAVERAPIKFDVDKGQGRLEIGGNIEADLAPYRHEVTGEPTKWIDTPFSTIPGNPAYVAKASLYRNETPKLGISLRLEGRNAIQGHFRFEG
jgi:hypothetical protein